MINGNGTHGEVEVQQSSIQRVAHGENGDVDLLAIIEKRNKLLERILEYAIRSTHPGQWFDLGGKAWPSGAACESMARRCGVRLLNVRNQKRTSSDDRGDFYIYTVEMTAELPSGFDSIEAFGTCSSRDTFLGTDTNAGRQLSEIDEGNIMKAAYTNAVVNAVTRLLGVRNVDWGRLAALGIDRAQVGKVEYASGAKGGGQRATGSDIEIKFGSGKGKTIGQLTDEELVWYLASAEKDLANPEKEKFKRNTEKMIAAIKGEQTARATKPKATPPKEPTPYEKCWALCVERGMREPNAINGILKTATGKGKPSDITADDVAKVSAHLAATDKADVSF